MHKFYFFLEAIKHGLYLRAFIHDLDKLDPKKFIPYANTCFKDSYNFNFGLTKSGFMDLKFEEYPSYFKAVFDHKKNNKHHWESWLVLDKDSNLFALPMDDSSIIEMYCDWRAANFARGSKWGYLRWYFLNKDKIILHQTTRIKIEFLLRKDFLECSDELIKNDIRNLL